MNHERRRLLLTAGLGAAAGLSASTAAAQTSQTATSARSIQAAQFGLTPDAGIDVTVAFQNAIDASAATGSILELPPGRFVTRTLTLRPGAQIAGAGHSTKLISITDQPLLRMSRGHALRLEDLEIDGVGQRMGDVNDGLISLADVADVSLTNVTIRGSRGRGLSMARCGGRVSALTISDIAHAGLFAIDSSGLLIERCTVSGCGDNGIQVWRSAPGEDGTQILNNRIQNIRSDSGGTGQNGNGINVFRANSVMVQGNRITDCAYSAIRGNSASNILMTANHIERIGEVALYAEFAFEGAVITGNLIDHAATGISVTNFNQGGRLAVVQGNLLRNLFRRDYEPVDKRGNGIAVEADCSVTGNTIENAPTAGIWIGWGQYMRNAQASGNVVRNCGDGIVVSGHVDTGSALISQNLFSEMRRAAIRLADLGNVYGRDLVNSPGSERVRISGNLST